MNHQLEAIRQEIRALSFMILAVSAVHALDEKGAEAASELVTQAQDAADKLAGQTR